MISDKLKTVIVENNRIDLDLLKKRIKETTNLIEIVGIAKNATSAVEVINKKKPDLVLLDIELNDSLGFEIFEELGQVNFFTICVSSHPNYAFTAYQHDSLHFIEKPVQKEDLIKGLEKLQNQWINKERQNDTEDLKRLKKLMDFNHYKIELPTDSKKEFISLKNIVSIHSYGRYCKVELIPLINSSRTSYEKVNRSISSFEKELENCPFVIRVHNRVIINLFQVNGEFNKNKYITLSNNESITVSRTYKDDFKIAMQQISNNK